VQQIDALQSQPVSLPAGLYEGCLWSPDQTRLGCLVRQGEQLTLQIVPAFGGTPLQSIPLQNATGVVKLVRWVDTSIYLAVHGQARPTALQRLNLTTAARTDVAGAWTSMPGVEELDVRPDGREVVLVVSGSNESQQLWLADIGGTKARQLTSDDDLYMKAMPVWSADGRTIVYQSNRGGQADLWEIDRRSGQQRRLTTSPAIERPESVSADGSVSFQLIDESAALWNWPITGASAGRPLNEESLSAFAPTLSRDGRVVAFQRSLPSPREGFVVMDSMLVVGEADRQGLRGLRDISNGFFPRLSPDGSRLAYYQRPSASAPTRVIVTNRTTGETLTLSEDGTLIGHRASFPVSWSDQPMVWSQGGDILYFVDRQEKAYRLRRERVADGQGGLATLRTTPDRIGDLQLSADGRQLAYMSGRDASADQASASSRDYDLHVIDTQTGSDAVWATFPAGSRMTCRGWASGGGSVVLVRTLMTHDDNTHRIELLLVSPSNSVRSLAVIDNVIQETLRMPASKPTVYMTRSEGGVANIYAWSLDTRALRAITDKSLVDVTFANVELVGDDRLVGVRDVRKHDIWLLDARAAQPGTPVPVSR
jgi:dipeptidyl aminopeptidase/acylaminoacyl peptidase